MLRVLIIALVLLVAAMLWLPRPGAIVPAPEVATVLPESLPLPEVALIDSAGRPFGREQLEGHYSLLFFGFTHCPDICPLSLQVLAEVRRTLAERGPDAVPEIVFVSVDPYRDTAERIAEYIAAFDPSFRGVTGSDQALAPWLTALGVTVHKNERDGEHYNVVHNGTVYVVGPAADLIAVFGGSSHHAETIVGDFSRIRARHSRAP